jgi:HPt (histidine-containing phosphotransfer) domain-containing protein
LSGFDLSIFDAQFAKNQFSGDQSLLVKILEKFIQQYQHFDTFLIERVQQKDSQLVDLQVHTLKGVSGNLGMKALHSACKELELYLANQVTEYTVEEFLQIFKQTLSLVQNYSAENGIQASPEATPEQYDKITLIAALKSHEFISDSKLQNYSQSLDLSPEKLIKLKQAIDNLDYAIAIVLLEK